MNEIRASHLVERAALRLRNDLGLGALSGSAAPAATAPLFAPETPEDAPAAYRTLDADVHAGGLPEATPRGPLSMPSVTEQEVVTPTPVDTEMLLRAGVVVSSGHRSRVVEEFSVTAGTLLRSLRSAKLSPGAFGNLLMVTSAKPGEGKSFSAVNMAATIANNGLARVILLDLDPKPGSLTSLLGLETRPGLFDLLADQALRPDDVLAATPIRDMTVLPHGSRAGAVGGASRRLTSAVERIARSFPGHVVILDAPPCLATSEPSTLAPIVGLIALIVEAERTQREELEHAVDMVKTCPNIMLVLNKIRGSGGYAFGDYDYYGV